MGITNREISKDIQRVKSAFRRLGRTSPSEVPAARPSAADLAAQMLAEEYGEAPAAPTSYSLAILRGLQTKHVYAGTVPAHVKKRRRVRNRVARKTRRLQRVRAQ